MSSTTACHASRRRSVLSGLAVVLALAGSACSPPPAGTVVRVSDHAVEFPAVVTRAAFDGRSDIAGYHFIVWRGGSSAGRSLFRAEVTDVQVLEALEALDAEPGNALRIDSWDDRYDAASRAPDRVIKGPHVEVGVIVPGSDEALALGEILIDPGGRGFEMRFGGHRDNIPEWHSGCVVCLYSCPGSKIGNARYTVRDFVEGATHFQVRRGVLPEDGTEVTIRVSLLEADSS